MYGWVNADGDVYPTAIQYNGYEIAFPRESRPDPMLFAASTILGQTAYRLNSVFVYVPGVSQIRAYKLDYTTSPQTGRSLLASVRQYGKDVQFDPGTGEITGGTSLPAQTFTYQNDALGKSFQSYTSEWWCNTDRVLMGDFNADGHTDQLCWYEGQPEGNRVRLSTGTGFAAPQTWLAGYAFQRPMAADMNNDGKADLVDYRYWDGIFNVAISTGTAFSTPAQWGVAQAWVPQHVACRVDPALTGVGDFNGDGLQDVWCKMVTSTTVFVGLSTGNALSFSAFLHGWACDTDERNGTMDFDGDGKEDWYCIGTQNRNLYVLRSTGSAFSGLAASTEIGFCGNADAFRMGDLNGDGRTDTFCNSSGKVALSTGRRFVTFGPYTVPGCLGATGSLMSDVDGDGSSELVCNTSSAVTVNKWAGSAFLPGEVWKQNWCTGPLGGGDFNGDGKSDLYCDTAATPMAVSGTSGFQSDLLGQVANGFGGTTQASYTPSSSFVNTNAPPPKHAVTSVTLNDGRGGVSTTGYTYSGGYIDRVARRFLGFRQMFEYLPCTAGETECPFVVTFLNQDLASAGKPERITRRSGTKRLSRIDFTYASDVQSVPMTSLLASQTVTFFDETGVVCSSFPCANNKRRRTDHNYDAYGNRTQSVALGDEDAPGDEVTTSWTYSPNPTVYIVDRVAYQQQFEGVGTAGTKLSEQVFWYDGATTWAQPPVKGDVSTSWRWLNTESRWVPRAFGHDDWGNVISVTDETNRPTTTTYDLVYHLYPTSVTNGAGDVSTTVWDPVCGVPTEVNGPNQVPATRATTQYDALCRPARTDTPGGGFKVWTYEALGHPEYAYPNSQRVVEYSLSPSADWDSSGDYYRKTYLDGFGRPYRTVAKGPDPNHDILQDMVYDARGQLGSQTAPYYPPVGPRTTTYGYDPLGRLTRVTHPDAAEIAKTYGLLSETTYDEHTDHPVTTRFDVYGRQVAREEPLGGQTLETGFTYDLLGRLVGMNDAMDNAWSWTHDSLGRTIAKADPDAGTWTYAYDDAARPVLQVDAKAQHTEFTYDTAGRLATRKTRESASSPAETTTLVRSESRPGFYNQGQVTSVSSTSPSSTPIDSMQINYDALGQVVNQSRQFDGLTFVSEWRYDAGGRLRGSTYPDGSSVGTAADPLRYDAAGRLTLAPGVINYVLYEASGRLGRRSNSNGTETTWTYSPDRSFLTGITTTLAGGPPGGIQALTYTPDPVGMVTQVVSGSTFGNESWSYTYDSLHRLTLASSQNPTSNTQQFEYDELGRITFNSRIGYYSYPSAGLPRPHAPTATGSITDYSYDDNGNLEAAGSRTIQWNVDNLPTQINDVQFTYGAVGDRIKKASTAGTSRYPLGDDYEVTNGVATRYIALPDVGLVAKRVDSATYWLHTDRLGSIQAITDLSGAVVQRRTYRPYGDKIADSTSHVESRGYIDQRQDAETGLTYLHARSYDPALGVFLSPDPLDPATAGFDRYAYAGGDPISRVDRSGLDDCPWSASWTSVGPLGGTDGGSSSGMDPAGSGWTCSGGTGGSLTWPGGGYEGLTDARLERRRDKLDLKLQDRSNGEQAPCSGPECEPPTQQPPPTCLDADCGGDPGGGNGGEEKPDATTQRTSVGTGGYGDLNVSYGIPKLWVGPTAGLNLTGDGKWCGYLGGGLMSPGGSAAGTVSTGQPSPGFNVGFQLTVFPLSGQLGTGRGGKFWEFGGGFPFGASLTVYHVWCE